MPPLSTLSIRGPGLESSEPAETVGMRMSRILWWAAIVGLVIPRLYSTSSLWLDEALSVNIASLPIPDLLAALRHDGSPPLYYLLLHGWIGLFRSGDLAVRSLSTLFSIAALPVAWQIGRLLGGRRAAAASALVLAASPFAIRFATETRMYALVMLLTLGWLLAVILAWGAPTVLRLLPVAVLSGALALTHYWTLFVIITAVAILTFFAARDRLVRPIVARLVLAMAAGGLAFLPWLPAFLYQAQHTGTPWAGTASWKDVLTSIQSWGGSGPLSVVWGFGLLCLGIVWVVLLLALAGSGVRHRGARWVFALAIGSLVCGLVVSGIQGAGFSPRYTSPMMALVSVAAGVGLARVHSPLRQMASVSLVLGSVIILVFSPLLASRTDADQISRTITSGASNGDTVVYCPDQLGPSVSRLLATSITQVVYPTGASPALVDWVDYSSRNAAASPTAFAAEISSQTSGTVWLVRADNYKTFGDQCASLDDALAALRGDRVVQLYPGTTRDGSYVISYAARLASSGQRTKGTS